MKSSFIKWILEQGHRNDPVGDVARWTLSEMEKGFDPVELHCIFSRMFDQNVETSFIAGTHQAFLEFASKLFGDAKDIEQLLTDKVTIIPEDDVLNAKLDNAVQSENYEEAAKIRDKIKDRKSKRD